MRSLLSGPYDENDAIAELHAGAGGTDAQDWTEMMLRMYSRWAERRGFDVEIDEATAGQEAGLLSATFIVKGRFAYGWLSAERGVHRLVRMSPFDSQARRQTSFASIDITPLLAEGSGEAEIDEKDLRIDTFRSSGAGDSTLTRRTRRFASRTFPRASCELPERAQPAPEPSAGDADPHGEVADRARIERQAQMDALSGTRSDNAWGSQIRSYVMAPYQLVKDHRTTTRRATSRPCSTATLTVSWRRSFDVSVNAHKNCQTLQNSEHSWHERHGRPN